MEKEPAFSRVMLASAGVASFSPYINGFLNRKA